MVSPLDLEGKRILVTGASSGIGREVSILLSELNARVVIAGRNRTRLENLAERLHGGGHTLEIFDLNELEEIPGWIRRIASTGGALTGIVHSAGLLALIPVAGLSVRKCDELMRVNLGAALMLAKGFRQKGCSTAGGSMVLMSAVLGLVGAAGAAVYSATKAALNGATRSLAVELAREGIRVNAVAPGVVDTEMTQRLWADLPPEYRDGLEKLYPLGFGTARDVAYGAAYLLADTARWVTGTTLVIDGGFTAR